jgi:TFIIF-interacting CTD phosphatase-like protein
VEGVYINKRKRIEDFLQYYSNIIEVYGDKSDEAADVQWISKNLKRIIKQ